MKKTISAIIASTVIAGSASAALLEGLSGSTTFAFESEYSFRGVKLAGPSIQPGVEVEYMGAYAGVWSSADIKDGGDVEVDYYVGYGLAVEDLTIDFGVTFYTYAQATDTQEVYAGFSYDLGLPVEPAVYFFYDFELEAFTIEGSTGYSVDLGDGLSLDFGGFLGYVLADDSDADYFYYGASADLVLSVTETTDAGVGVRVAGNDADDLPDTQFWGGAFVSVSF